MLERTLFEPEHEQFRDAFGRFIETEMLPHAKRWAKNQGADRDIWHKAGAAGYLCPTIPEEYGGAGGDRRFSMVIIEELARKRAGGPGFTLQSDIVAPYILNYGTEAQKQHYLPKLASGDLISAIAMTEPGTGSDLQGIQTKAVRDGDELVINGTKMFITNGYSSELVIVVTQLIDPKGDNEPRMTLVLVEAGTEGFTKEKPFKKLGQHAQDTCALHFSDVRVPVANILGGEEKIGGAIGMLFGELAWERLIIAIGAVAEAEFCVDEAVKYTRDREAFGRPLAKFQDIRFKLAEMKAETNIGRTYVDACMAQMLRGDLAAEDAATAKYWCSEMAFKIADMAVQMHGGYGYMMEYPVTQVFASTRVHRIYGGTNEIMKELIARSL